VAARCRYDGRLTLFFIFEARQRAITVCSGLPQPTKQVQIFKKVDQTAITICSGLLYPTMAAQPSKDMYITAFFSRAEKPSEDITRCLFLMNMKGFKVVKIKSVTLCMSDDGFFKFKFCFLVKKIQLNFYCFYEKTY
jgi:hypothetical protein